MMFDDVLSLARPGDKIMLFYTDASPRVLFKDIDTLTSSGAGGGAEVRLIRCNRTGNNKDNALDFQLVSELGYQIARNACLGILEVYYLISCDGGFDAVVSYWRARNILIQRLVTAQNPNQTLPRGPMLTETGGPSPLAISPAFAEISKVARRFHSLLKNTAYAVWDYRIAESFVRLLHLHEAGSNDKFVLAFRNEMNHMFGSGNDVYKLLKPAFASAKIIVLDSDGSERPSEKAGDNAAMLLAREENLEAMAACVQSEPLITSENAAGEAPAKPLYQIIPDDELKQIFKLHNVSGTLKAQLTSKLSGKLKSEAFAIMGLMASSYDDDVDKWNRRYLKLLRSRYDVTSMPPLAKTITTSYWPKVTKTAIAEALKRLT